MELKEKNEAKIYDRSRKCVALRTQSRRLTC